MADDGQDGNYGRARLADFLLDPAILHLNHGSYGAATRRALTAQDAVRRRMEGATSSFFRYDYMPAMDRARVAAAAAFGGDPADWALVENATQGCNAVIAATPLAAGDEVLVLQPVYGAVRKAALYHAGLRGARLVEVPVPVPIEDGAQIVAAVEVALTGRTRLAIFDHVTSPTATILPVADLTALCRRAGVPVLIDGAHAPGMLALDVPVIGADWYVGNAHKWLCAPKGCAVIWAARDRQAGLHPVTISHGLGAGFGAEFGWTGTRDASAQIVLPEVMAVFAAMGGARLMARNRALAAEAGVVVARALGGALICPPGMNGAMVTIALPVVADAADPDRMVADFGRRHPAETAFVAVGGRIGVRLSAHIYNELDDYEQLAVWLRDFFG
jgi:isopenicillin-N epimerase